MSRILIAVIALAASCSAATLQQLSIDEMAQQSTAIVRARIISTSASFTGPTVYTHYKLAITETLKGIPSTEFVLPGGVTGQYRQSYPGVPAVETGKEYLLFLWTSTTRLTHLVGLSQGIFYVSAASDGSLLASRGAIGELMLDHSGRPVRDQALQIRVSDIRVRTATRQSLSGTNR